VKYQTCSQTISYAPDFTVVNYSQKLPTNLAQISATGGKALLEVPMETIIPPLPAIMKISYIKIYLA
jgi:hypothetical protein